MKESDIIMTPEWEDGAPPKDDKTYLLKFSGGVICSGRYRQGVFGEPQQIYKYWRCDCCGHFATPKYYAVING